MAREADNALSSEFDSHTVVLDVETTTHNKGHPFDPRNKLVSYADNSCYKYHTDPDFKTYLEWLAESPNTLVVGFNFKFDLHWLTTLGVNFTDVPIWDCQLAEFVYSGQKDVLISLNECLERYSLPTKTDEVKAMWDAGIQTDEIPLPILEEYNRWDVYTTRLLYDVQQQLLSDKQKALVLLLGEDLKVLAHIEQSGIKFDREGAKRAEETISHQTAEAESLLREFLPVDARPYFNFNSGDDLSAFLYGGTIEYDYAISKEAVYKSGDKKGQAYISNKWFVKPVIYEQRFVPLEGTEVAKTKDKQVDTHFYQTDEPTLKQLKSRRKEDKEILALLAERAAVGKVGEMLVSIEKQFTTKGWTNNLMHGQYNQNIVVTGRLSSSAPNQQNMPEDVSRFLISRYD